MSEKIGVFICECGPNIKEAIEINEVIHTIQDKENVTLVERFRLLCSDEGKEFLKNHIQEHNLTRVVIAACSPKEHEATFRKVVGEAGLNPFLMHIANIREQCAWVIPDKVLATQKASAVISAAVKRVVFHEPLKMQEILCQHDVLVVGAGVAGISAALALAQKNRKIYLIERMPCIGGKVALYEDIFPSMECASCMLSPKLDEVLHHDNIEILTLSEVREVSGFYGNFIAKVRQNARFVDSKTCIGCGACSEVCPVEVNNEYNEGLDTRKAIYIPYPGALPNIAAVDKKHCLRLLGTECNACQNSCPFGSINFSDTDQIQELTIGAIVVATGFDLFNSGNVSNYGYGEIANVYTSLEFERLLNANGPTKGDIVLKNGKTPEKIAFLHCVGSRTTKHNEYCSGICCTYLLKFAHLTLKKLPNASIVEFYSDFCMPGIETQKFFNVISQEQRIQFIHLKNPDSIEIKNINGTILIQYKEASGISKKLTSDMVVLAPALVGAQGVQDMAKIFGIPQGEQGFFIAENTTLAPVSTTTKGIFIAGCAQGPKNIEASVAQGQAAASMILSSLIPGEKLVLDSVTTVVNRDLCSGCKTCTEICPFQAITYDDKKKCTEINEVLCRGCGICASVCPSGALKAKHFTDQQIFAEVQEIING